jgi:hypothetical protein
VRLLKILVKKMKEGRGEKKASNIEELILVTRQAAIAVDNRYNKIFINLFA